MYGYWCERCQKFVMAESGAFDHPHLGMKPCMICRHCGRMVYIKPLETGEKIS